MTYFHATSPLLDPGNKVSLGASAVAFATGLSCRENAGHWTGPDMVVLARAATAVVIHTSGPEALDQFTGEISAHVCRGALRHQHAQRSCYHYSATSGSVFPTCQL
jgi:hypothetical protein